MRRFALAKVAAKPSEGASWSRNGRTEKTNGQSAGGRKGISFMQNNISVFMVK
ncbi:MAG: hypothetical protein E6164_04200 [Dialister sp.]|nr:hypothetical protein [Dialister sp.]